MTVFVDPRIRMRNALRSLVEADPLHWHEPSLVVFRNRLLDQTGSDARPLAELLLEALQRGWQDRMPRERVEPARWDALSAPFVMQWSAERFIQHDMAQWATECWALAFGVIAPEQLRIAPPPAPAPPRPRPRQVSAAATATAPSTTSRGGRATTRAGASGRTSATSGATVARVGTTARTRQSRYVPSTYASMAAPNPKLVWSFAGAAVFMYLFFIGRMYVTVRANKRAEAAALAAAPARTDTATASASANTTTTTPTPTPANANANARTTATSAPNPGVPSVTRNMLDQRIADPNRMLYVEPARRAQGNSRPVPTAAAPASLAYDEMVLNDATTMRGRVEIVRAGTVIFRDMRTGLRHEIRKDDIDRIITEFGASVRFRVADASSTSSSNATSSKSPTPSSAVAASAKSRAATGPRGRGVAGAYLLRYSAAVAVGSPECTDVWRRPPDATDRAVVRHAPGADTLTVVFDGGDSFLSNMDAEGYFASTFRIVPDQARTSTALTTRLTGQFKGDGSLALQVNIVFFRRMREGRDVTCNVTVNAAGRREGA